MQDYILDSKNEDKIYRIKLALLNLDRWDFAVGEAKREGAIVG